jgi:acyl carrier protein
MRTRTSSTDLGTLVVRILATELKASEDRIREAKSLRRDLGMDSIAAANAAFALEDECDIDLDIGEDDTFDTVEEIVAVVRRALKLR